MSNFLDDSWRKIWAVGRGHTGQYCGIAGTEDGFAVDVFDKDTCVWSELFSSREDAEKMALSLRGRFAKAVAVTSSTTLSQRATA